MSAEILNLPGARPPVRLTFSNTPRPTSNLDRYSLCQLAGASDDLIAAQGELSDATRALLRGKSVPDHDATMTGETLELVLRAAIQIILFSGASNRDRPLLQPLRDWINANGTGHHD